MKTVSGKVVSSHPMSLSRAAKYLSMFTSSPNEASPAFAAYLRRTSDAFNQLVHLHKHCNIPIGEDSMLTNHNHDHALTHATATSVAIVGKAKRKTLDDDHSRDAHRYDSPSVGMDLKVQDDRRIIEGDVSDVRSDLNKSKKKNKNKKERDGDVAIAEDIHGDDHYAIKMDDVKTEKTRLDGSEEMTVAHLGAAAKKSKKNKAKDVQLNGVDDGVEVKEVKTEMGGLVASEESKKKKKSKRDKHQKKNHSGATEAVKDVPLHPGADTGEVAETVHNIGDERKKHKKKRKIKEDGDARNKLKEDKESITNKTAEQIGEIKLENKHQVLSEKKQRYEGEEGENGRNVETEAVHKKESRKRKHERVAFGELEGLQEAVKSKKKKL